MIPEHGVKDKYSKKILVLQPVADVLKNTIAEFVPDYYFKMTSFLD